MTWLLPPRNYFEGGPDLALSWTSIVGVGKIGWRGRFRLGNLELGVEINEMINNPVQIFDSRIEYPAVKV